MCVQSLWRFAAVLHASKRSVTRRRIPRPTRWSSLGGGPGVQHETRGEFVEVKDSAVVGGVRRGGGVESRTPGVNRP